MLDRSDPLELRARDQKLTPLTDRSASDLRRVLRVAALALTAACSHRYPDARALAELVQPLPDLPAVPLRCLVANHVHTIVSDRYSHDPRPQQAAWAYSPRGLHDAIAAFQRDGVVAIVLTDHNAIDANFDPQIARAPIAVIPGMEWTTRRGHALLIGFAAVDRNDAILPPPWRSATTRADFQAMVDRTHARGGLVIIAHPRVPLRTWPDDSFGADGVEVWGLDLALMRNGAAQRWWHERLVGGERLLAIAGTDLHPGATIRRHRHPLNWVYAARCDPTAILAAIRAGHLLVVRDAHAPQVLLGLEAGGALDFADAREGDSLALTGPTVDVQLRVLAGAGATLTVLGRAGLLHTRPIATADELVRLHLRAAPGDFIRAELRSGRQLLALTNPVYLR
ncbi:CehA/McbA family metallohydrolase [Nannocystis sp.]|uniref:CehA/McbA family metallohydrolase n=1 Tax=Nannocystis sp. TaxID=1962667 RepID=UPI0025EA5928|nr:CehA/McbA family metallohydrolase [Nannocystis sp.]MBK7828781.1 CehA/McbA family metallohydrolase [Nannocystis sp.]